MVKQQVDLKSHPLRGMSLIEASAGTGKTFTISHLYLRCLLETDYEVRQILVVTFTNAATQELRGRIRKLIYEVSQYLHDINIKKPEFDTLFGEYRLQHDALVKLHRALINFDEASIYSIHGFCQRILNSFPIETKSLLEQQIVPDEKQMLLQAIRDYWRKFIINTELTRLQWILQNWKEPEVLLKLNVASPVAIVACVDLHRHNRWCVSRGANPLKGTTPDLLFCFWATRLIEKRCSSTQSQSISFDHD